MYDCMSMTELGGPSWKRLLNLVGWVLARFQSNSSHLYVFKFPILSCSMGPIAMPGGLDQEILYFFLSSYENIVGMFVTGNAPLGARQNLRPINWNPYRAEEYNSDHTIWRFSICPASTQYFIIKVSSYSYMPINF